MAIKANTKEAYFKRFHELIQEYETHIEAYENLEAEQIQLTGSNRYSNYASFKKNKSQFLKAKKNPKVIWL